MLNFSFPSSVDAFVVLVKADNMVSKATTNDFFDSLKGTTDDKEDIFRIELNKLLVRMLPTTLWWDIGHRSFKDLQKGLLHAFPRHITGNRWIFRFTGNFVDFIDKDDPPFGAFDIVIRFLNET